MKALAAAALICSALNPFNLTASEPIVSQLAEPMSPKQIQVLLEKDVSEALLEVRGPYYIVNPHDGVRVASGLLGKRFMIHELENGLKWGEEFPGIHQFTIKPRSNETAIFVNGIQYEGSVTIYGVSSLINIVNEIDIESYVKAILSNKFSTPLESEVMSALAILTRTDAYYRATRNPNSYWHASAQEVGYQGSALVIDNSLIEKAVDSTKHLILVHPENGRNLPFATAWTEHSAGKTAPYYSLFRKEGFGPEKGVEAPHAALARSSSKWSYQISKRALADRLRIAQVKSVELFVDEPSNKVYGIRVKDNSASHDFDFFSLQEKLGKSHLQSSEFTVSVKDETITFTGYGKGHGVGLCLYSAAALAANGENAVKILSKFFPQTYLYNLGAQPLRNGKEKF